MNGYPNFTRSAFTHNSEIATLFSHRDTGAIEAYEQISGTLYDYWEMGRKFEAKDLEGYRAIWKNQQRRIDRLSGEYTRKKPADKSPLDVPLFVMPWKEYFNKVKVDPQHSAEGRLQVLDVARNLFSEHDTFSEIPPEDRKKIAGFGKGEGLDFGWFGSMVGAGDFKGTVNSKSLELAEAIDLIPLTGPVDRQQFDEYLARFTAAVGNKGIATATRLLAMKRPDYFVCLDSKNKDALCKAFERPKKNEVGRR